MFGCFLAKLCSADESTVPIFVQKVIQIIESKAENMKADGIYRASGNLSQIQKIRYQVQLDQVYDIADLNNHFNWIRC